MALSATPPPTKKQFTGPQSRKNEHELSTHPPDGLEAENKEQETSIPLIYDIQLESAQVPEPAPDALPAKEWVSGFKLLTIITAITLVCLLMLLDTSIVVTACT